MLKFVKLSLGKTEQLLKFESDNRAWFESLISPRTDNFYQRAGIEQHIDTLDKAMGTKSVFAGVALLNDEIVGRGNLKDINQLEKSAYVGYRIGQQHTGKGIASFCLKELIDLARDELNLKLLFAEVLDNNPASMRVLIKQGFKVVGYQKQHSVIHGISYGCTLLKKSL